MADVTLTYKGSTIAEMNATGTKTLKTSGKYCEGDIGVSYVKPSSGGSGFWDEDYARQMIEKTITSINFPSGRTKIGSYSMSGFNGITSISIPNGVTTIDNNAFYYCNRLVSISLPESIRIIGASAFYRCEKLESISYQIYLLLRTALSHIVNHLHQ